MKKLFFSYISKTYLYGGVLGIGTMLVIGSTMITVEFQNKRMKQYLHSLQQKVSHLQKQVDYLQQEVQAIQQNPTYVEFLLRTKLYYRRPDEISKESLKKFYE